MTTAFSQVQALIPKLAPEERTKIRMLLTKHAGVKESRAAISVNTARADWLLQGYLDELERRGQKYHVGGMAQIRVLCADYEMNAQAVRANLEEMLDEPSRAELLTLGTLIAKALIRRFPKLPIGLQPLLSVTGRALEALDDSFPGYIAAGMLSCLITRKL